MKQPADTFRAIPFPECATNCAAVEYLGVGECESVCPHKFDERGRTLDGAELPSSLYELRRQLLAAEKPD